MSILRCELTKSEYFLSEKEINFYSNRELDFPSRTEIERLRSILSLVPQPHFGSSSLQAINGEFNTTAYGALSIDNNVFIDFQGDYTISTFGEFQTLFLKFFGSVSLVDQVTNYGNPLLYGSSNIKNSFDCNFCNNCKNCYQLLLSSNCENVFYSRFVNNCRDSYFLENCDNCSNCLFCSNIHDQEFFVFNKKVSKENFDEILNGLSLASSVQLEQAYERFENFLSNQPLFETYRKNSYKRGFPQENHRDGISFFSRNCKNCSSLFGCDGLENSYACFGCSGQFKNCHNSSLLFGNGDEIFRSISCFGENTNLEFCIACEDSSHLFCCYGLKNKTYCIFNKQLTKREYFRAITSIKKFFKSDGFSIGLLFDQAKLFPYNLSLAEIVFPINKVQAEMMGYLWDNLKDKVRIPDSNTNELICTITGVPFVITQEEVDFLNENNLAKPVRSPQQRFKDRISLLSLTPRNFSKCAVTGVNLSNWQQIKRVSLSRKAYEEISNER